jgi:GMP synthase-like glutamine amidotransferase
MTNRRRFVIIDPGMRQPENTTYNIVSNWVADFRAIPEFFIHSVQFVISHFCKTRLRDVVQNEEVVGILSLGSFANITDHLDWVETLQGDLQPLLFEQGVPFLGVCFSHQLLAHMGNNPVGFLHKRHEVPNGKRVGFRTTQLNHPKFAALWATLDGSDLASGNRTDLEYREVLKAVRHWPIARWDLLRDEKNRDRLTAAELRVQTFLRENSPDSYIARVAHEQEVLSLTNPEFRACAQSPECDIDALFHESLPLFSLQSHPETYHESGDGWRLIRNFIYFCGMT